MQFNVHGVLESSSNNQNLACYAMGDNGKECLAGDEVLIRNGNSKHSANSSLPIAPPDGSLSTKIC